MSDGQGDIDNGRKTILDEAAELTSGDRNRDYDHPLPNHERIAALWSAYFSGKTGKPVVIDADDVCWCIVCVKMARDMHRPKRDNLVDVAGYVRCIEMMRDRRQDTPTTEATP